MYRAGVMSKVDPKGYYACLGVEPWATADQIRAAYHRGARLYHPDHNPSPRAKARFQAINEAYRTLSNPTTRRAYDRSRVGLLPAGRHGTDLGPVRWRRTELEASSRAPGSKRLAQFIGVWSTRAGLAGAAVRGGCGATRLRAAVRHLLPGILSICHPTRACQGLSRGPSADITQPAGVKSGFQHRVGFTSTRLQLRTRPSRVHGCFVPSEPEARPEPLAGEEAARLQEQLIARGYLIGPADGVWGPRAHARLRISGVPRGLSRTMAGRRRHTRPLDRSGRKRQERRP